MSDTHTSLHMCLFDVCTCMYISRRTCLFIDELSPSQTFWSSVYKKYFEICGFTCWCFIYIMTLLNMANEAIPFAQSRLKKKKKTPLQVNRILFGVQKYKGWDEAGLLSRIRSGITWTGSSTRCNPLISLLCTACPGSQVVPIWTLLTHLLTHSRGVGWLQMRDSVREP